MKGTLVFLIFLGLTSIGFAQNVTAYWTLTWNGNCSNTIGPVEGTPIVRVSPAPVPTISITDDGAGSNGWNVGSLNAGRYYQYTLIASANVVINSFSLTAKVTQANMHGSIRYSLDGFTTHTNLLANYTFPDVNPHTYSNLAPAIHIANGQTLTIRVYAWNANTRAKIFSNKELIMYGNVESLVSDYFRTKTNGTWNDIATWESSADGINWYDATLIPTVAANSVTILHDINLTADAACGNLIFANGSITLGNYQMVVSTITTGPSLFVYNGSGGLSGPGAVNVNTLLGINSSNTIPSIVNSIHVNPGLGNTAELPNNVTTTILTFESGSLSFNGYELTLANKDFAVKGTQTISGLAVSLSNTSHTYDGNTSLEHTWQTSGIIEGTVDVTLSYPSSLSSSSLIRVYQRNHIDGESIWSMVGTFSTIDHGTYFTITIPGITILNGSRGDLDWTISEPDETLPVEFASLTAYTTIDGNILLNWTTHSETDVLGYHVFRNTENLLSTANCLTQALIPATNTSFTHNYTFTDDEVGIEHVTYYYWIQYTEFSGNTVLNGPVTIEVNANHETNHTIPLTTSMQALFPNPFQRSTTIQYGLKTGERISIEIFNIKGQIVNKLYSGFKDAGNYIINWNGKDLNASECKAGIYYIVMKTGSVRNIRKVVKI